MFNSSKNCPILINKVGSNMFNLSLNYVFWYHRNTLNFTYVVVGIWVKELALFIRYLLLPKTLKSGTYFHLTVWKIYIFIFNILFVLLLMYCYFLRKIYFPLWLSSDVVNREQMGQSNVKGEIGQKYECE